MSRRRYAIVGLGARSEMYVKALSKTFTEQAELVALCDVNPGRLEVAASEAEQYGSARPQLFDAADFDEMVKSCKPDEIIVTVPDYMHDVYICRAMELGCDVISEKPMTTNEEKCIKILETRKRTGKNLRVTFNYRYSPLRSQVKEILDEGKLGKILSIDFIWPLDTYHGADYFRRWHRERDNSGSMLVHKSTHHFDLVNWWLGDKPAEVFCHGTRSFYTPETADQLGLQNRSERCLDCPCRDKCKFVLKLEESPRLKKIYLDCEQHDGYFRDRCVFSDKITIWDNMSVSVKYQGGAIMNYLLHTYSPWEGYKIDFNCTAGRLEHGTAQYSYVSGSDDLAIPGQMKDEGAYTTIMPQFVNSHDFESVKLAQAQGGHGGGDDPMLNDIFNRREKIDDPLGRAANHIDGAYSILTGIAARRSAETGKMIKIDDLLGGVPIE